MKIRRTVLAASALQLAIAASAWAQSISWEPNTAQGLQRAKAEKKPVLVFLTAPG